MKKTWLTAFVLAGATGIFAQTELMRVQRQIEQARREVEAERQSYESDLARQKAWESASRGQLADTRAQARRARIEADSLARALAAAGNPAEDKAREQKRLQTEAEALAREIADRVDALLAKIQREELPGFAESKERGLRDLSRGLRTGVVPPEDGLARLADALSELIDRGRKVEARNGSYTALDGRPLDGVYVSAGGFFEGFVSKDGAFGAYRHKGPDGWAWKESLPAERRQNLLKISRMLASEEEPGFVPLPFGIVSGQVSGGVQ
jgi:multidrug efflux pump subunit AcrA (membrane-fusion protein)